MPLGIPLQQLTLKVQTLLDSLDLCLGILGAALIAVCTLHGVVFHLCIELDLRFCTGRTNGDLGAILAEPLQHVAGGRHVQRLLAAVGIGLLQGSIVFPNDYL